MSRIENYLNIIYESNKSESYVNVTGQQAEEILIHTLKYAIIEEISDKSTIKQVTLITRVVNFDYKVEDKFLILIPITWFDSSFVRKNKRFTKKGLQESNR